MQALYVIIFQAKLLWTEKGNLANAFGSLAHIFIAGEVLVFLGEAALARTLLPPYLYKAYS